VDKTLDSADSKILELAKAYRFTTEVRKAIFCVIMTAEDFLDAFEKLLKLDLRGKQDREIVQVLLQCCAKVIIILPLF
jgi:nucleolar MIF4G domain-containing protein 1